jgi:ATP-dependent RNA helicase RhlE
MSFESLNIDPRCLSILKAQRIENPTPVQAQAIPVALEGRDLIAIAQTGTGKTLAFGLPALTRLKDAKPGRTQMLVLAPTRELACQVHSVLEHFAKPMGLRTACIYGGVGMEPQTKALRSGAAIIVATPGRLLDHVGRRNTNFDMVSVLVLDEADRMLDMGFMPAIKRILAVLPKERQTMMFSATFPDEIAEMTKSMQRDPVRVQCGPIATPAKDVRQGVYNVNHDKKLGLLSQILRKPEVTSTVVFLRTKHRTERVAKSLHEAGFKAQAIHGDRSQRQRQQAIDGFRQGRYNVLVATDVAARGLDVQGITHVVNFDIPMTPDDYIHRIGRTARANASGDAITFVAPDDMSTLRDIERALGSRIPRESWAADPTPAGADADVLPEETRRNAHARPQQGRRENQRRDRKGHSAAKPGQARPAHARDSQNGPPRPQSPHRPAKPAHARDAQQRSSEHPRRDRRDATQRAGEQPRHERSNHAPRSNERPRNERSNQAQRSSEQPRHDRHESQPRHERHDAKRESQPQSAPRAEAAAKPAAKQSAWRKFFGPRQRREESAQR